MDKLLIVANIKSYKTENEAKEWLEGFKKIRELGKDFLSKEIVVCPPFTLLSFFSLFFSTNNLPFKVGAQNVSPFDEGAYTGEVNAKQLKDFVEYVLIGHSERRNNFLESEEMLSKKVELSLEYGLKPIFLVQTSDNLIPKGVEIVAYEPIFAIGTSTPDTPENADKIAALLKEKNNYEVLYGGSVTSENVARFTQMENIKGVLVGGASLDPAEFIKIIQNA